MNFRLVKPLAANMLVGLSALTMAFASPLAAVCLCDATGYCGQATASGQPACACSEGCCQTSSSSCCAANLPADSRTDSGCSCSRAAEPLVALNSQPVADDARADSSPLAPAHAALANIGLHGADWSTAFNLAASGNPLGLRLHALLGVWRI